VSNCGRPQLESGKRHETGLGLAPKYDGGMKVAIVGTGYVGLVTGTCLSQLGHDVGCVDLDASRVRLLSGGEIPMYEPGLQELVRSNIGLGRLSFTVDLEDALIGVDIVFIAVGTPTGGDGHADLAQVLNASRSIGKAFARRPSEYAVVVTKSTVPVGTSMRVMDEIRVGLQEGQIDGIEATQFDVASNPEFLKEGDAVADFRSPDRIVIGVETERARQVLANLYESFAEKTPILFMNLASAELSKYAANSMLATRISFMNSIANLSEKVGADISMVKRAVGSDARIGPHFLNPGPGYGGSCFPKDVLALRATAVAFDVDFGILREIESVNDFQKHLGVQKLRELLGRPTGSLSGLVVAVLGVAFKPNTDDTRGSPALTIIEDLLRSSATVRVYDPAAVVPAEFDGKVQVFQDKIEATSGADALMLVTEWREFEGLKPDDLNMKGRILVDTRNVLDADVFVSAGFAVARIGHAAVYPIGFQPPV
jgi:UDPglucose 6-dehydrogenase